jgi:hypothetical protein
VSLAMEAAQVVLVLLTTPSMPSQLYVEEVGPLTPSLHEFICGLLEKLLPQKTKDCTPPIGKRGAKPGPLAFITK